jgi:uncharacterized membrane protein YbaN (DUF454 family)
VRWAWIGAGWLAVALGGIGVVVPGWPTTVFFIVAASCFARGSPRFERWVLGLPGVGPVVRDYRAGLGMRPSAKAWAIGTMVAAVALSAGFLITSTFWRVLVVLLGAAGVWYVGWRVPTRREP